MGFLKQLLKDSTEIAATVIAHAAVTGADIIDNAGKKRTELGQKFEERATRAVEKVERTRENLAQAIEDHVNAFGEALHTAINELEQEHEAASQPAPKATVAEATPAAVEETKPGLKAAQPAAAPKAAKKPRKRTPRKPS